MIHISHVLGGIWLCILPLLRRNLMFDLELQVKSTTVDKYLLMNNSGSAVLQSAVSQCWLLWGFFVFLFFTPVGFFYFFVFCNLFLSKLFYYIFLAHLFIRLLSFLIASYLVHTQLGQATLII